MLGLLGSLLGGLGKGISGLGGALGGVLPGLKVGQGMMPSQEMPQPPMQSPLSQGGLFGGGLLSKLVGGGQQQGPAMGAPNQMGVPMMDQGGLVPTRNPLSTQDIPKPSPQPTGVTSLSHYYEPPSSGLASSVAGDGSKLSGVPKTNQITSMIDERVKAVGSPLPPSYFQTMAKIESGYNPAAVSPTGAKGLFQFTTGTWHDFGTGDRLNPVANTDAAIKLANSNYNYLNNKLGRPPTPAEVYMAHNIGAGGAYSLLNANPLQPVSAAMVGSKLQHNPSFFLDKSGNPLQVREVIQRYSAKFQGVR